MNSPRDIIRKLAECRRAEVLLLDLLADALALAAPETDATAWTSDNRPPGVSRRTFRTECKSGRVAGATLDGKVWACSRAAWAAARARQPSPVAPAPVADVVHIDDWIAAAGLRPTTRGHTK